MSMLDSIISAIMRFVHPAMTPTEVSTALDDLASNGSGRLDWRNSIVDLMKLLNLDSSLAARRTLATELGHDGAFDGTAEQNIWLHKKVLARVAERNIKIPV